MGFIRWSWENYWLTWRKSFDFRGVTTRSRFWSFVLVEILLLIAYALCFSGLVALVSQGKPISNPAMGGLLQASARHFCHIFHGLGLATTVVPDKEN